MNNDINQLPERSLYYSLPQDIEKPYRRFPYAIDFSEVAVLDMLRYLGAADIYHIYAGKYVYWDIKNYLSKMTEKLPFYPVVNLTYERKLSGREWYIAAINFERDEARSVGTSGC